MDKINILKKSAVSQGNAKFEISEESLKISSDLRTLSRCCYRIGVPKGVCHFNFSARCDKRANTAYEMISQYRSDGSFIIRMYADFNDGKIAKKFSIDEQCVQIGIEFGVKGKGCAVWSNAELVEAEPDKPRRIKVAATRLGSAKSSAGALENAEGVVAKAGAAGADVIVLGEMINEFGCPSLPQEENGEFCTSMCRLAKKYKTYIVANFREKDQDNVYNTSFLINRCGEICGKYRKTHISFNEYESGVTPGDELPVFDTDFGKVAMLICWDMYFPEPSRVLALKGAEIIFVSTGGDPSFRHVSRALENGVYVAVSGNMCQNLNDSGLYPSKIISPDGEVLSQTNTVGDFAMAEIDINDKRPIYWLSAAASFTVPGNIYKNERRTDLYKIISEGSK